MAVLLHVVGTQQMYIQYTAVRVHEGGTYYTVHSSQQQRATAVIVHSCLLYTSPSPRDLSTSRMPSSA